MNVSRRRALALLAGGAVAAAGADLLRRSHRAAPREWLRRVRTAASAVALPDGEPGALGPEARSTMLALPSALVDREVGTTHYDDFFRFRSESVRGYRALYESFSADLAAVAAGVSGASFAASAPAARRVMLRELGLTSSPPGALRALLGDRRNLLYDRFVVRETLQLFSATDAWILAGYGAWPGQPRTVDHYLRPASAAS
jgi:hypothetical protein